MRNVLFFLSAVSLAAIFTSGCTGPQEKLGRGMDNVCDIARMGEFRRSMEQSAVFDGNYTTGLVRGFDRTVARTGMGLYEIVTFPIPPYRPLFARYIPPGPAYPDNYKPGIIAGPMFDSHTYIGFSGGDVAPFIPGSRFKVFESN